MEFPVKYSHYAPFSVQIYQTFLGVGDFYGVLESILDYSKKNNITIFRKGFKIM